MPRQDNSPTSVVSPPRLVHNPHVDSWLFQKKSEKLAQPAGRCNSGGGGEGRVVLGNPSPYKRPGKDPPIKRMGVLVGTKVLFCGHGILKH